MLSMESLPFFVIPTQFHCDASSTHSTNFWFSDFRFSESFSSWVYDVTTFLWNDILSTVQGNCFCDSLEGIASGLPEANAIGKQQRSIAAHKRKETARRCMRVVGIACHCCMRVVSRKIPSVFIFSADLCGTKHFRRFPLSPGQEYQRKRV